MFEGDFVGFRKLLLALVPRIPTGREGILLVCEGFGKVTIDGRFKVEFRLVGRLYG